MRSFAIFIKINIFAVFALLFLCPLPGVEAGRQGIRFDRVLNIGSAIRYGACIQDSDGFLWVPTQGALVRYDGYNLKYFKTGGADSISDNVVNTIFEDGEGVLWIGTYGGGLNKYDKRTGVFTHYLNDPADPGSLSNNTVWAIHEENNGALWIATSRGFNKFDKKTETFTNYLSDPGNPNSLSHNLVRSIYAAGEGDARVLWLGTTGIDRFHIASERFTNFRHNPDAPDKTVGGAIWSIVRGDGDVLWVGTLGSGLHKFDLKTETFTGYFHDPNNPDSPASNDTKTIFKDASGKLWLGTRGGGLDIFDPHRGKFAHYVHDPDDPDSLSGNSIEHIMEDDSGIIWIFCSDGSVDKFDKKRKEFSLFRHNPNNPNSLSNNAVAALFEDGGGALWIGGYMTGGLSRLDRRTGRFTHYESNPDDPTSLRYGFVKAILEDRSGNFWVSSTNYSESPLCLFDRKTGKVVKRYTHDPNDPDSMIANSITLWSIIEDRDDPDILWIATNGAGIEKFNKKTEKFAHYPPDRNNPAALSGTGVFSLYDDGKGALWVGTQNDGLNKFDKATETFTHYRHIPGDPLSLGAGTVWAIYEDSSRNLWVAASGSGLHKFNRENGSFTQYATEAGLPDLTVFCILEDRKGHLWLSTAGGGIARFNPSTGKVEKVYDKSDGLQGDAFFVSGAKTGDGQMWFGGTTGLTGFYPEAITDNSYVPPIVTTSIRQGGQEIGFGKAVEKVESIELDWRRNFFEFEFAALNYTQPLKNRYKYLLEGFDKDWFDSGTLRVGRYTGLPGGKYTLRVKGSNNDGIWNENGIAIAVNVVPPFWRTSWFYGILILTVASTILSVFHYLAKLNKEINERMQAEESLRWSLSFAEKLIEAIPDPVFYKNTKGIYQGCNSAYAKILGLSIQEVVGKSVYDIAPKELADKYFEMDSALFAKPGIQMYESTFLCADGSLRDVIFRRSTFSDHHGAPAGIISVMIDITDRKRAEEERARLATAIEQASDGVFVLDTDWLISYANPAFCRMSGYDRTELIGRHPRILESGEHDRAFYVGLVDRLSGGEAWSGRITNRRKDGGLYLVEATVSPIRNAAGEIINYVSIHRDITHQVKLETELNQARKMEAIGLLAGGIAHDFNNILAAIMGFTELSLLRTPAESPVRGNLEQVLLASSRASDLVKQILTFTRRGEQERKPVRLSPLIQEVLRLLRSSLPSTIEILCEIDVEPDEDVVLADPTQIQQVMMNLCANAGHAMREKGGALSVRLSETSGRPLISRHPDLKPGPHLCLTIGDTGHGMDAAVLERIFDPYFTTKETGEGCGLGLSVVHGIVKNHGGAVSVYSEPGRGTTFHVFLPVAKESVAPEITRREALPTGAERILFVDDEKSLVVLGTQMLESLGYRITARTSSVEALEVFRADPGAFDLVVTDMTMPNLTGAALIEGISAIRNGVPVVLCSGFSELIHGEQAAQLGICGFVTKPYTIAALAKAVRKALDSK